MNFEVQYTLHGLFALTLQNTEDYPLKCCMVHQKCKNNISGGSFQKMPLTDALKVFNDSSKHQMVLKRKVGYNKNNI